MQQILDRIERDYYKEHWKNYLGEVYKPEPIVYNILKLADAYSVYQWCLNEKALGNSSDCIGEIYFESKERLDKYTNEINKLIEKEAK